VLIATHSLFVRRHQRDATEMRLARFH